MIDVLFIWLLCGAISAVIGSKKGHSGCGWFAAGFLLGPFGIVMALGVRKDAGSLERAELERGAVKKCPFCAELVKAEAIRCRFCGADLSATAQAVLEPPRGKFRMEIDTVVGLTGDRTSLVGYVRDAEVRVGDRLALHRREGDVLSVTCEEIRIGSASVESARPSDRAEIVTRIAASTASKGDVLSLIDPP